MSTTDTAAPAASSTPSIAQKFEQAALAIVTSLEKVVATSDAEQLVENLVHAVLNGIVDGVELASPPGIVSIEKMAFPWLVTKGDAAADGLIHVLFAKLSAKVGATAPAPSPSALPTDPAAAVNAIG